MLFEGSSANGAIAAVAALAFSLVAQLELLLLFEPFSATQPFETHRIISYLFTFFRTFQPYRDLVSQFC